MLMGVFCTVEPRRSAVTTTSMTSLVAGDAAAAEAACSTLGALAALAGAGLCANAARGNTPIAAQMGSRR